MSRGTSRLLIKCLTPFVVAGTVAAILFAWRHPGPMPAPACGPLLPPGRARPQFAANAYTLAVLAPDGEVWISGWIPYEMFIGAAGTPPRPGILPLLSGHHWSRIALGSLHVLLIHEDGTLWGLGDNRSGQLGLPGRTNYTVTRIDASTNWVGIAAGNAHSAALKNDGSLWTWGDLQYPRKNGTPVSGLPKTVPSLVRFPGDQRWKSVVAAGDHTFALREDGTLHDLPPAAIGVTTNQVTTVPVGEGQRWSSMDAGGQFVVAIGEDRQLAMGRLNPPGDSGSVSPILLERVPDSAGREWREALTDSDTILARDSEGAWWGLGNNSTGVLGLGHRDPRKSLERLPWPREVLSARVGMNSAYFLLGDGTLWRTGSAPRDFFRNHGTSPAHILYSALTQIGGLLGVPGSSTSQRARENRRPGVEWTWPGAATSLNAPPQLKEAP